MRPEWFSYDNLPFDRMWRDDREWFKYLLADQPFVGEFHFSQVKALCFDAKHGSRPLMREIISGSRYYPSSEPSDSLRGTFGVRPLLPYTLNLN